MGVGRREALGVRQVAAGLLLCTNNVPVPKRPLAEHREALLGWADRGALPQACYF
ncbi:MAG: hypothetical protein GX456_15115 [Verrucomicrobia bacterium]|nr:hypothetical protein [Verrucomicrobiota bacterium]